jgi:hypothetical protein
MPDMCGTGRRPRVADVVEVGRTGARFGSSRNRERWADVEPDVEQPKLGEPAPDEPIGAEHGQHEPAPEVGRTGARFGSSRSRYRWQRDEDERSTGAQHRQRAAEPDEDEAAYTQPMPAPAKPLPPPPPHYPEGDLDWDDLDRDEEPSSLVRPYARTGGRTEASRELRLETLISVNRRDVVLGMEHRRIVEICERTSSVAEVAAALPAPLGVARVLIDDLIELGVLTVHTGDSRPDEALLVRVLAGLRRL